jgi:hypothetical protein
VCWPNSRMQETLCLTLSFFEIAAQPRQILAMAISRAEHSPVSATQELRCYSPGVANLVSPTNA